MPETALGPERNLQAFARKLLDIGIKAEFDHSRLDAGNPLSLLTIVDCQQMDIFNGEEDWDTELITFDVHEILGLWVMFTERFDLPVNLSLALHYIIDEMLSDPAQMILELLLCTRTLSNRNKPLFLSIMKWLKFKFSMDSTKLNESIEEALLLYSMQEGLSPLDRTDWRAPVLADLLGQEKIPKLSRLEQARDWLKMQLEDVFSNF
jgi:hypothetical protein